MSDKPKTMQEQLEEIQLESAKLSLIKLRRDVQRQQQEERMIELRDANQIRSLADYNRQQQLNRENCNHRKGGDGLDGLRGNGQDPKYSIIKQTEPWGETYVLCSRCQNEWRHPRWVMRRAKSVGSDEHPKPNSTEWRKMEKEYREALRWPTDNQPSGTQLFQFERSSSALEAASV